MSATIHISEETKSLISTFGNKKESYDIIIRRMYDFAVKEQLRQLLLLSENTISIDEARRRIKQQWPNTRHQ